MLGLTQYPAAKDYDLSALRFGFCGAAPLSGELQQRVSSILGFPVLQGYGLTETSPYCNSDYLEPHLTKPGSIGPAGPDMEEKVRGRGNRHGRVGSRTRSASCWLGALR